MKLTRTLYSGLRDVTVRKWNKVWKCRGRFYDYPPIIPQVLQEKGIEVVEMNQLKPELSKWTPPVPDDPRFAMPVPPEERSDWKDEPAYTYHQRIRMFEGVKQACLIAKAVHNEGLPPSVDRLVGAVEIEDRDLLLQRYIMQSQVWNTTEDKLPKRVDPRKPGWKFQRQYGIPAYKSSLILLKNLLRLSQSQVSKFPSLANRKQIFQPMIDSYVMYQDKPLVVKRPLEFLLTSDTPLPPFGNEDAVDDTITQTIPDMWPAYPTVDFLSTNNYEFNNLTGFSQMHKFYHPHTIVEVPRVGWWQDTHYQASQILSCLMVSAALARTKFGDDVRILPEPISVQHVSLRETTFHLTFFQLNTLDLNPESGGIKNLVWTDERGQLCQKVLGQPWMPRPMKKNHLKDFDGTVFDRFLAAYLNGVPELNSR